MPTFPVVQPLADRDIRNAPHADHQRSRQAPRYRDIDQLAAGDALMQELVTRGKRLIDRGIAVLILGETGSGKEYLARALHDYSWRRQAAWVAVNCASIPESLVESELFGYSRGAFSGALPGGMKGRIQQADGGTLFLDEIGDMPFALQTRLLRVLSEREVTPLGALRPVPVDLQLICATHQNLQSLIAAGRFREDLYYRVAGGVLRLPSLRERSDLRQLVMQMMAAELDEADEAAVERCIAPDALQRLLDFSWPGNLRQLHAVIRYGCAVMNGHRIEMQDLPEELMQAQLTPPARSQPPEVSVAGVAVQGTQGAQGAAGTQAAHGDDLRHDERSRVIAALNGSRWNISAASRQLGMCRASLYRKLRQLEIPHVRDQAMPDWAVA